MTRKRRPWPHPELAFSCPARPGGICLALIICSGIPGFRPKSSLWYKALSFEFNLCWLSVFQRHESKLFFRRPEIYRWYLSFRWIFHSARWDFSENRSWRNTERASPSFNQARIASPGYAICFISRYCCHSFVKLPGKIARYAVYWK